MGLQILILVLQAGGVLLAGAVLATLWPAGRFRTNFAVATAAAAAAWLAVGIPVSTRSAIPQIDQAHATLNMGADAQRRYCLNEPGGVSPAFVDFLSHQMGQRDRYVLYVSDTLRAQSLPLCLDFMLLPRVEVANPKKAQWAVFADSTPPQWRAALARRSPNTFRVAPGLTLMRLRANAG